MSTIWSFDLGKASIGEAVRFLSDDPNDPRNHEFLHKASLLMPAEFASTKEAAARRRMWRTRQAHKAREAWLDEVWSAAGQTPLKARAVHPLKDPTTGKERWELNPPADYPMEREFAPRQFRTDKIGNVVAITYPNGKAKDGAPAATKDDFVKCYTSSLLRIKLLRWKEGEPKWEPWQIYKALHSAIQRRGYPKPPFPKTTIWI